MQRRYNLTHLILAGVVVLGLTPLMAVVDAQAQITFISDRDGHVHPRFGWHSFEIYVMEVDGGLTNNPNWAQPSDGKRIAFRSDRDGNDEIYVMDTDGDNPQNLTNDPNEILLPHGLLTVNGLPSRLIEMGIGMGTGQTMKST